MKPALGQRVKVERDESRYPRKAAWKRFRGRIGTVVEVNRDRRPHLTEYGVVFGSVSERPDRPGTYAWGGNAAVVWFKCHELTEVRCAARPSRSPVSELLC